MAESQARPVDLSSLSSQQLGSVKKQLDEELEHLTNSFTKLRNAQTKFRECLKSIDSGVAQQNIGRPILIPLTASLYVPGQLSDTENVIVDVGTGFYVEKTKPDAAEFYNDRISGLGQNLKDLEAIVQGKSANLRSVEDVLRQKVLEGTAETSQ